MSASTMTPHRRQAGLTLIEVLISLAALAGILIMTNMIMKASLLSVEMTSNQADAESKAAALMEMIAKELKDSGTKYSNFTIGTSQQSITFARCNGYSGTLPTFGNQVTYAFVTYGSASCLQRTEIVSGVSTQQILTDQLASIPVTVTTAQGVNISVTGINFQTLSAGVVTVSLVLRKHNYLLRLNTTALDDSMYVSSQSSVQMLNNN